MSNIIIVYNIFFIIFVVIILILLKKNSILNDEIGSLAESLKNANQKAYTASNYNKIKLKRYKAVSFEYDSELDEGVALDIIEDKNGEFVKYEDIKHLLKGK